MRILFLGDLVGRTGRAAAIAALPRLRRDLALDFVIVNGENAAGGFGITQKICAEVYEAGADVITTGNHVWDQKETVGFIGNDGRLLRPENFPEGTPGRGYGIYTAKNGKAVLVANLMGRLFMDPLDDPFAAAERILGRIQLGRDVAALVFDFHAEATSEKMAFAHMVDGRASLVVGTHTHVPTADHMILTGGTAYMSDAGMCGDYDSVIGMRKTEPIARFLRKLPTASRRPKARRRFPASLSRPTRKAGSRAGSSPYARAASSRPPSRQGARSRWGPRHERARRPGRDRHRRQHRYRRRDRRGLRGRRRAGRAGRPQP